MKKNNNINDHKFAFIICANDLLLLEECIHYINHLNIPEGYELDVLSINEATCITDAYNEAMSSSDAKYKIYMHQDVFILNKNLLGDLLEIFNSDAKIGMIGMVGYESVSTDGIMWHTKRLGNLYLSHPEYTYPSLSDYRYQLHEDNYSLVAEIDGFFMATCLDLPWDRRLTGWDFYDAFHSMNFLLQGYKIAVPLQIYPWCMHDSGKISNLTNYNQARQLFFDIFPNCLGKHWSDIYRKSPK